MGTYLKKIAPPPSPSIDQGAYMRDEIIAQLKEHNFSVEENDQQVGALADLISEIAKENGSGAAFLGNVADLLQDSLEKMESKNPDHSREYMNFREAFSGSLKEWPVTAAQIGDKATDLENAFVNLHEVEVHDPYNGMPGESYDFYEGVMSSIRNAGLSLSHGRGR